jgi:alpha-N-arabinofuranosidase
MAGAIRIHPYDARQTPFHKPHSTELAGMHDNPHGDDRYYNNLFVGAADLTQYDEAPMPVFMDGNVFLKGAKPSKHEKSPVLDTGFDPGLKLAEKPDGFYLELVFGKSWLERTRRLVTTETLGQAAIAKLPYERPDGAPIRIKTDYFGKSRDETNPTPGPFESPGTGLLILKVW